ncbi:hypothetical protein [Rurimicrobium arvi]|uniref:Uncharacterized protein n=1 Tax=Rurimicrobium arvi TaxID=2049916 RepID=A0ABP8MU04_9BACT
MQQQAGIIRWNIDFSDEERVLKIVANTDIGQEVTHLFTRLGFTANLMAVYYAPPV